MNFIGAAVVVVLAQLMPGLWASARISRWGGLGVGAFVALVPLSGLIIMSGLTLLAGHLGLLGAWLLGILIIGGLILVLIDRDLVLESTVVALRTVRRQWKLAPISVSVVGFTLVLAAVASLAPPFRVDEVEYHWAAPLEWAEAGRWMASSFRHVDSFPLMEIAYTAPATVGSYAGAHLMHLSTLVGLGCAAAVAARSVGVKAVGAVAAAAMVMPVVWDQAYVAYNDTAAGAFSLMAVAVALSRGEGRRWMALVCLLLAAAISIKPTALGALGLVGLVILITEVQRSDRFQNSLVNAVRLWTPLVATGLAVVAFWTVRRFALTGTWIDPAIASPPSADELARLPTLSDQLMAPVMPLALPLLGAQEPWGGRTGAILLLLLPALIYAIWVRGKVGARFTITALPAWIHWVIVGFAGVRTRFHVVSWALFVVAIRVVVEDAVGRYPRLRAVLALVWSGAVVLGCIDVSLEMLRVIQTISLDGGTT